MTFLGREKGWYKGRDIVRCVGFYAKKKKKKANGGKSTSRTEKGVGSERKGKRAKGKGVVGLLRRGNLVRLELFLGLSGVDVEPFGGRAFVVLVSRDDVPNSGDDDDTHEDNYGIVHAITGDGDRSGHAEEWNGQKTPRCKGSAALDMSP